MFPELSKSPFIGVFVLLFVLFSIFVFYTTLRDLQRFTVFLIPIFFFYFSHFFFCLYSSFFIFSFFIIIILSMWFTLVNSQTEHPVAIPWNLQDLKSLNTELGHLKEKKYHVVLLFFCSFYIMYVFFSIYFLFFSHLFSFSPS